MSRDTHTDNSLVQEKSQGLSPEQRVSQEERVKGAEVRLRMSVATCWNSCQLNEDINLLRKQHRENMNRYQAFFDEEFESLDDEIKSVLGLVEADIDDFEEDYAAARENLDFAKEKLENLKLCLIRQARANSKRANKKKAGPKC
jgi:hypothetical protein